MSGRKVATIFVDALFHADEDIVQYVSTSMFSFELSLSPSKTKTAGVRENFNRTCRARTGYRKI